MAQAFPTLDLRPATSPDVYQPPRERDVGTGLTALSGEADQLGQTLQSMAAAAAKREGTDAAAKDVAAGAVTPRQDGTVSGEAYDTVAKNFLSANRQAQMHQDLAGIYSQNPDNPVALGTALDARYQAEKDNPTPYGDVNADLLGHFAVQRADYVARAIAGARQATMANDRGAMLQDFQNGQDLLDQVSAGAPSDAAGGQRITAAATLLTNTLSKYGPKEAYDLAGVHFDADPNRRAAFSPAELAAQLKGTEAQARKTWITATAQQLTDEASRKRFAADVMDKWRGGDPSFAGLDGKDMDEIQRQLEAGADRARADARAAQSQASEKARGAIQAFSWGGSPDLEEAARQAKLSGDAGLQAEVDFYSHADAATKGVLKTVVARQLGLLGNGGPSVVAVDANGQPLPGATPDAVAASARADPAGFFGKVLGKPVTVTSGARTAAQNAAAGGVADSAHLANNAWDLVVPGQSSAETFAQLRQSGVPFDQLIDEHDHVHFSAAPAMRAQALVKNGGAWTTPPSIAPGTPTYMAWASAQEGFTTDPLKYVRGGAQRPAIANVPILVPQGGLAAPNDPAQQAWAASLQKRRALGQGLSQTYGVPARMLDDGEVTFYKGQIAANPMASVTLARNAMAAVGQDGATRLMQELGETGPEASLHLHLGTLEAMGAGTIVTRALGGLTLQAQGRSLSPNAKQGLDRAFDSLRGIVPPATLTAAYGTAHAAMISDETAGTASDPDAVASSALGGNSWKGNNYGGVAKLNGAQTILPAWLNGDHADDALKTLGDGWLKAGNGPHWANGEPVSGDQMSGMRLSLQPNGHYALVFPRTGERLTGPGGGPFVFDLDRARDYLGQRLSSAAVRPRVVH